MHMADQSNTTDAERPRRPYRMQGRQDAIERTRDRIVAAAFELHATIGPSRTTVSGIAERAGVQRHTVYAHFPDTDTLFEACTAHGMRTTRMPDPTSWATIDDAADRLRHGLGELAAWYRTNERMLAATCIADVDPAAPPIREPGPRSNGAWPRNPRDAPRAVGRGRPAPTPAGRGRRSCHRVHDLAIAGGGRTRRHPDRADPHRAR